MRPGAGTGATIDGMKIGTLLVGAGLLLSVTACGKEEARIPFTAEGPGQATASMKAGDIAFWTDIDVSFEGNAGLVYKIDVVQNNQTVASTTCNPFGQIPVKTTWVETNAGDKHSRSGNGKMACDAKLAAAGDTTIKATLSWSQKPATVAFKKADLVIKQ